MQKTRLFFPPPPHPSTSFLSVLPFSLWIFCIALENCCDTLLWRNFQQIKYFTGGLEIFRMFAVPTGTISYLNK